MVNNSNSGSYISHEQGRKLYTHAPNLPIQKQDSQNFMAQKETNQGWNLEVLKFEPRNGSENQ